MSTESTGTLPDERAPMIAPSDLSQRLYRTYQVWQSWLDESLSQTSTGSLTTLICDLQQTVARIEEELARRPGVKTPQEKER